MDIQTKDGILLRNIPDGTPEDQIKSRIASIRQERGTSAPEIETPKPEKFGDRLNREVFSSSEKPQLPWSDVPGQALSNIPKSGAEFLGNIYQAVSSPIETAGNIKDVFVGGVQNALPESMQSESARPQREAASAVGKFFKDRYGSVEGLKQTIANDPVGLLADVSSVATGGGALAAKIPGMAGVGKVASAVGRAVDPLRLTAKAVSPVASAAGRGVANVIGGIGTHTGGQSLKTAANAGFGGGQHAADFLDNLRGNVSAEDVVSDAKRAVSNMAKERSALYRSGMSGVSADKTVLDFAPIDQAIQNVSKIGTFKGKSISRSTTGTMKQITDIVDDWKSANPAEFHTPEGLDALKKSIGDIRDSTEFRTPARALADNVYGAIKTQINKQAPQYGKVMKGYEQASKQIREIEKGLSLGEKASTDTALRKLQSVMRNNANTNYGNRVRMAEVLEDAGAGTLLDKLAGQSLSAWTPRGLGALQAGSTAAASAAMANPWLLAALAPQSPRLVGEAAYYAGKAARPIAMASEAVSPYAVPAFQAGRIQELVQDE